MSRDRWPLGGPADGPALAPSPGVTARIAALGAPLGVDVRPLLDERAGIAGLGRQGRTTCGGAGRLIRSADGWVAVNLPRPEDLDAVAAWLEVAPADDPWPVVEREVPARPTAHLLAQARLLGLAVAALGETAAGATPLGAVRVGDAEPLGRPPLVVDLSSLWAGPLCTRLLVERGATVVKVEAPDRPDGARAGPREFFDRLNAGKQQLTCALGSPELAGLLRRADVVVEASRRRALLQHGIVAEELAPRVWISITGYGRAIDRVAFGDDAAVAGGLVVHDDAGPMFLGDATADPLTGVAAAAAAVDALHRGGRWLIDAAMSRVAAWCAAGNDAPRRHVRSAGSSTHPGGPAA